MRWSKLFILGLFFVGPVWSLTLSDIRTQIRRNVRDTATDTSRQRYSNAIILDWVNEAQRDVVNLSWPLSNTTFFTLIEGTTFYPLPNSYLATLRVEFQKQGSSTVDILDQVTIKRLDDENVGWRTHAGSPAEYMVRRSTDLTDPHLVAFIPPATNTSTGTVTIEYAAQVTDLSSDSDAPFEGYRVLYPYHYTLVWWVTERVKAIEGKLEDAKYYRDLYDRSVAIMRDRLGRRPDYTPGMQGAPR